MWNLLVNAEVKEKPTKCVKVLFHYSFSAPADEVHSSKIYSNWIWCGDDDDYNDAGGWSI